ELRILLPMVTTVSELRTARQRLAAAAERAGLAAPPALGVMIEVPAAALLAARLGTMADFFSIGTNDLAQYGLAVDRSNSEVSALFRPLHPAILRMVKCVVDAGAALARPVAICGEMAADPLGLVALIGLGIRELSVTPVAIANVKESLSAIDSREAAMVAERALEASEASEVERLIRELMQN